MLCLPHAHLEVDFPRLEWCEYVSLVGCGTMMDSTCDIAKEGKKGPNEDRSRLLASLERRRRWSAAAAAVAKIDNARPLILPAEK